MNSSTLNKSKRKILKENILENKYYIICTLLWAIFFIFFFIPIISRLEFIKNFSNSNSIGIFCGLTSIIFIILIYFRKNIQITLNKYKNTFNLEKRPANYIDGIFLFIIFSIILIIPFRSFPSGSYAFKGFLYGNVIAILFWLIYNFFHKIKNEIVVKSEIDKYPLIDDPIEYEEQDFLDKEEYVKSLHEIINNIAFGDSYHDSIVLGLIGKLGEGKTSVINLLRNKLKYDDKLIIVNFNPWHYENIKAMLTAFYRQIEESINEEYIFTDIKKAFLKYKDIILSGISYTGIKLNIPKNEDSLDKIRQKIELDILKINKKILIIVDDIDRLDSKDILFILKTVRLNTKFKNTIFLLIFDPERIINNDEYDKEFLEKFVQIKIHLPKIEQNDIDEFLFKYIKNIFSKIKISKEDIEIFYEKFIKIYNEQIRKLFTTLRSVKRYLYGLHITLPPIKSEVNLCDFFILEVIRYFYPEVYNDIWKNKWSYIPESIRDYSHFSPYMLGEDVNPTIKNHIEKLIKDEKEADILKVLLKKLFFVVRNALDDRNEDHAYIMDKYRSEKRITHPECFEKYFVLKVPSSELSDELVEMVLDLWNKTEKNEKESKIEKIIIEFHNNKILIKFFERLEIFRNKIDQDTAYEIIKVIYKNANNFSIEDEKGQLFIEFGKAIQLTMSLINYCVKKDDIKKVLEEVITLTPDFHFAVKVIDYCTTSDIYFSNIYKFANIEELKTKLAYRMKKHFIDGKRDIFDEIQEIWAYILFQWGSNWDSSKSDNRDIVTKYIVYLTENNVNKFVRFLSANANPIHFDDNIFFDLNSLNLMSSAYNLEVLNKLAEKFKDNNSSTPKENNCIKDFLEKYKLYRDKKDEKK